MSSNLEPEHLAIKMDIPGPGTYEPTVQINKYGHYNVSTIENTRAAAWSPSKRRFIDDLKEKRKIPGPGNYDNIDYSGGKYLLSSFKNFGTRKMMPDRHQDLSKKTKTKFSETPGPG